MQRSKDSIGKMQSLHILPTAAILAVVLFDTVKMMNANRKTATKKIKQEQKLKISKYSLYDKN
jgi:hypothetical protein